MSRPIFQKYFQYKKNSKIPKNQISKQRKKGKKEKIWKNQQEEKINYVKNTLKIQIF